VPLQCLCKANRGQVANTAGSPAALAEMDQSTQEGPCREADRSTGESITSGGDHSFDLARTYIEISDLGRHDGKPRLPGYKLLDSLAIKRPVRLCTWSPYSRALPAIQNPELYPGRVRRAGHNSIQRVDLAHKMSLAQSANGRIAGHDPDRLDPLGEKCSPGAKARCSASRLDAGMSATYHNDIEIAHGVAYLPPGKCVKSGVSRETFTDRCSFPDAETSKDLVENLLDLNLSDQPVKRQARQP
jgi:hypothetical protein